MRADIAIILDRLKKTLGQLPQIKAFVFGSAVQTNSPPNDIDILVIYMDPALPARIREVVFKIEYMPIHLIFLTPEEELETDFVRKQKCIPIL